jgi:chromosome segregation ATPase
MTKQEMIVEAAASLENERLEALKAKTLAELRYAEARVASAKEKVIKLRKEIDEAEAELEKENEALAQYREDGDYEKYLSNSGYCKGTTLYIGSSTLQMGTITPNIRFFQ